MGFMTRLGLFGAVTSKQSAGSSGGGAGAGRSAGAASSSSSAASTAIVPAAGTGGGKAYAFETLGDFVKAMDQGGTSALEICAIDMKVRAQSAARRAAGGNSAHAHACTTSHPTHPS